MTRHESHALVSQLDAFPTALAAAGLAPGKPVDGRSLLPLLEGKTEASPNENIFSAGVQSVNWSDSYFTPGALEVKEPNNYAESGKCPYYAWVQNPETLLMYVTPTKPGVYAEFPTGRPAQKLFFNLPADPRQTNNIFGDTPAVQTAAGELRGWLQQTQPPPLKHLDDYQELLQLSGRHPRRFPEWIH